MGMNSFLLETKNLSATRKNKQKSRKVSNSYQLPPKQKYSFQNQPSRSGDEKQENRLGKISEKKPVELFSKGEKKGKRKVE